MYLIKIHIVFPVNKTEITKGHSMKQQKQSRCSCAVTDAAEAHFQVFKSERKYLPACVGLSGRTWSRCHTPGSDIELLNAFLLDMKISIC